MDKQMQEWIDRVEKLHQEIKDNPYHAKYRDCEEDNQHPFWEPLLFVTKEKRD